MHTPRNETSDGRWCKKSLEFSFKEPSLNLSKFDLSKLSTKIINFQKMDIIKNIFLSPISK